MDQMQIDIEDGRRIRLLCHHMRFPDFLEEGLWRHFVLADYFISRFWFSAFPFSGDPSVEAGRESVLNPLTSQPEGIVLGLGNGSTIGVEEAFLFSSGVVMVVSPFYVDVGCTGFFIFTAYGIIRPA
jgi:hypothetical protein